MFLEKSKICSPDHKETLLRNWMVHNSQHKSTLFNPALTYFNIQIDLLKFLNFTPFFVHYHPVISRISFLRHVMWIRITTAWCVLGLRVEETASKYGM